ncbi:MAG: MFS transporter [Firmicutes bacterium]|nr:MFS transporter [Bacillota bacterium]
MSTEWVRRTVPPLMRDVHFRRYWLGQSISLMGGQISMLAFPLTAVLVLKTNAIGMALITAVGSLPALLFSVPIGSWVDGRASRRQIMIVADLLRALLILMIPLAMTASLLSLPVLVGLWFGVGICSVFFRVSSSTVFVALVPSGQYLEANGMLQQSQATAFLFGPALGGWLIQLLSAPVALLGDALSFVVSAATLSLVHPKESRAFHEANRNIWEGMRFIRSAPILREIFMAQMTQNFFRAAFTTVYILFATRYLRVTPEQWGLIFGPSSVLALLGSSVTTRMANRIGLGRTLVVGSTLLNLPMLVVPLIGGQHWTVVAALFMAEGVSGAGAMIRAITVGTIQAVSIPDDIRARVMAGFTTAGTGMTPLGAGFAALLSWLAGIHYTVLVATLGLSVSFLWLLRPRVLSLRNHKELQPLVT